MRSFAKAGEPQAKTCRIFESVRPVETREQLIVSPRPPLIKDVIEKAEVPRLENATDTDDEPFEMEQTGILLL